MPNPPKHESEEELREALRKFGSEFDWPWRFMKDMERTPADQRPEAQERVLDEMMQLIKEREIRSKIEENQIVLSAAEDFSDQDTVVSTIIYYHSARITQLESLLTKQEGES